MNGDPLFNEILSFWTDLEVECFVKNLNFLEEAPDSKNFLSRLELKVAERHQATTIVDCSFVVFKNSKLVEELLHKFIGAFLRYIVDKHFLPDFVFGTHLI